MVRWSLCEGRLNIKKRKKQSVPGKMVVVVRWSFYGRSFWPGGTVCVCVSFLFLSHMVHFFMKQDFRYEPSVISIIQISNLIQG